MQIVLSDSLLFSVAPDCECSTWGIQHYMTFDGQLIHFMGGCKYNLVTSKNTKLPDFAVEIKNDLRGKTQMFSYRLVDIRINGATIILWPGNKLSVSKINITFDKCAQLSVHFNCIFLKHLINACPRKVVRL